MMSIGSSVIRFPSPSSYYVLRRRQRFHDTLSGAMNEDAPRLRLLYELGCAFAAQVDLDELSAVVIAKCREVLRAEGAAILLLDSERNELYFPYVADEDPEVSNRLRQLRFAATHGVAGAVLQSGHPLQVDDVSADARFYDGVDRRTGLTTRNLLCAPLRARQGVIGVIQVLNAHRGRFRDDDLAFLEALGGSIAVAIENARMYAQLRQQVAALEQAVQEHHQLVALRHELDIASSIQQSILPQTFPPFPERRDVDIFAAMLPAREVGGDFYDFFLIDDTHLGFVIGDVSGKGVPAALFMAVSRTLLKSIALRGVPPDECLRHVNSLLCLENAEEMFVTIFYGVLDLRTGSIAYSNGGHNPPYLLRRDRVPAVLAGTGGMGLGVMPDIAYQAKQAVLQPDEGVFLYTDGITEAMDSAGRLFSDRRLARYLGTANGAPAEQVVRGLVDHVRQYAGSAPQSDDMSALAITYLG
jgi:phosphoserine phosphatase RsbU/P